MIPILHLPILYPAQYTFENKEYIVVPNDEKRDVEDTTP